MNRLTSKLDYAEINERSLRELSFRRQAVTLNSVSKDALRESYNLLYDKLAEYEELEERGLLYRLPCKTGEDVYVIKPKGDTIVDCDKYCGCELHEIDIVFDGDICCKYSRGECPPVIVPVRVESFEIFKNRLYPCQYAYGDYIEIDNYYATREEAEKALKEMEAQINE